MSPISSPSTRNLESTRLRRSPSAIEVAISLVLSITFIIMVLEMLRTTTSAMMTFITNTCREKRRTVLL